MKKLHVNFKLLAVIILSAMLFPSIVPMSAASAQAVGTPTTEQENQPSGCNAEPCSVTPSSSTSTPPVQSFAATGSVTGITDPTLVPNPSVYDFSVDAEFSAPTSFPGGTFSGDRQVRVVGSSWATWNPQLIGKHLLFATSGTIDILFASPQTGVVVKAEPNLYDWYNITVEAFDSSGASLGSFTQSIYGYGGASFLGVLSTSTNIAKITLSSETAAAGFAFSDLTYSVREPVILLPGGTGSRIFVPQDFNWSQPDGHGGTYSNTYHADDEIWINAVQIGLTGPDDYFDVLRLEKDGVHQSTEANYGVKLEARGIVDMVDVYNSLLADLENAGYRTGTDLFVSPYDWRLDVGSNAVLLDNVVQDALVKANGTSDQSKWAITKVNLVSHSMGAPLAREYIRDPLHAARVHRLIAIAPAFLGAPKFTRLLLFGDPLICIILNRYICPLDPAEVKDIAQNMPGLFEVAPSRAYWTFYDGSSGNPVVFQEDRDFDGDNQESGALSYTSYKSMLFRLDRDANQDWDGTGKDINQTVFNMSESFHDPLDLSWDAGIPVPEVDLIVGTGQCTIGQIQPTYRIKLNVPIVGPKQFGPVTHLNYVNGDNTVPLFSAALYDPARGIDHRGGANVYYVARDHTDHAMLPSTDPVRQLVVNLLKGDSSLPGGIISEADVPKRQCKVINVESPVEVHVTDTAGNHTGWTNLPDTGGPAIEQGIPGSMYNETDETKSVVLPDDGVYTISLNSTGSGSFNLNLQSYKSDGTVQSTLYLRAPLTTTTTGTMTYDTTSSEPPLLYLDHNGDGIFEETIAATSVLSPAESADTQPPQIEITSPMQGQVSTGNTLTSWQVSDILSGVLNEWGYIDIDTPTVLEVTNGSSITLPAGQHTLTVLAEDRAGNASEKVVNFNVTATPAFPTTGILDNFNRASGSIGSSWYGNTSGYNISSNKLLVKSRNANLDIYWNNASFGPNQEAYFTFSSVNNTAIDQDLVLKSQYVYGWAYGLIDVQYEAAANRVVVWTYDHDQSWVQYGADIPVTFVNGDQFGARALSNGTVEVYRNGVLIATRDISAWPHNASGGYLGLWFGNAKDALIDDFGGGTIP